MHIMATLLWLCAATVLAPVCAMGYGYRSYRPPQRSTDGAPGLPLNVDAFRVLHPAFPEGLRRPLSRPEAARVLELQSALGAAEDRAEALAQTLPWKVLPEIGVVDRANALSKAQLEAAFEEHKHIGLLLWAYKTRALETGVVLLNHWAQRAVLLTAYSSDGATGEELLTGRGEPAHYSWPALALDFEVAQDLWQPVQVSASFREALPLLQFAPRGAWELALLLLVPAEEGSAERALLDTGLCAQRGLAAYLRVLGGLVQRSEEWDDVPAHMKISERSILKQ